MFLFQPCVLLTYFTGLDFALQRANMQRPGAVASLIVRVQSYSNMHACTREAGSQPARQPARQQAASQAASERIS